MANNKIITKFADPTEAYMAYTSELVFPNEGAAGFHQTCLVQVELDSGTLTIQGRVSDEAPWVTLKTYTASGMDYLHNAPEMRVQSSGQAKAWLAETR
jgi:hypothetical protein